jgi:hypothetical protein
LFFKKPVINLEREYTHDLISSFPISLFIVKSRKPNRNDNARRRGRGSWKEKLER